MLNSLRLKCTKCSKPGRPVVERVVLVRRGIFRLQCGATRSAITPISKGCLSLEHATTDRKEFQQVFPLISKD